VATKTLIELIDDTDGSTADEEVTFGLDGVTYQIDLSEANAEKLREELDHWIAHGRRTGGRQATHSRARAPRENLVPDTRPTYSVPERHAIQAFANRNGLAVPGDRGRIARSVSDAWENAGRP
jgi:hypothetical protein